MARILVIDDDKLIRESLTRCFAGLNHEVLGASNLAQGRTMADSGVDVIFLDLGLPDGDGSQVIDVLSAARGEPEVIVITGLGSNYGAREAMAAGAWDYVRKPMTPATLRESLQSALDYRAQHRSEAPHGRADPCGIIGQSPAMRRTLDQIFRAAGSEAAVLVLGETGVGKELAARAVHANSPRRNGRFVVVDCSNITETLMESMLYGHAKGAFTGAHTARQGLVAQADGGTLFLDEVGELPLGLQKSFLRVLQEQHFRAVGEAGMRVSNFRLVAATNRDLERLVDQGRFRKDLLFRLKTVEVHIPPLRDRLEDLAQLAEHFAQAACSRSGLPPKRLARQVPPLLAGYAWPGNVRELGNVMEAGVVAAGQDSVLYPKHLPQNIRLTGLAEDHTPPRAAQPDPADLADLSDQPNLPNPADSAADGHHPPLAYREYKALRDKQYFQDLMEACGWDITEASRLSGLSVPSVYRHLGLAGISTKKPGSQR